MMDLNDLYFRHQISLMRVSEAGGTEIRACHQAKADELAHDIGQWQQMVGAGVASRWDGSHVVGQQLSSQRMNDLDGICS